jgi:hypothetical protein
MVTDTTGAEFIRALASEFGGRTTDRGKQLVILERITSDTEISFDLEHQINSLFLNISMELTCVCNSDVSDFQ